jgi:2-C-methyl-D-erythritol 2,4-cyclodiphosphate synthase
MMAMRVGIGYDVHPRAEGRPLVLGGVRFESPWGLAGHSDADVLTHAVGDAVLGSLGLGDLGTHFPPSDARWKDASSLDLLKRIREMALRRGATIVNVDVTLVAEEPRVSPHYRAMRVNLAEALAIGEDRVSVKSTTHEKLGALGRGEGLAAWAVALVELP